jgi:5-methylcytosine-specific restriction enzyme subunit McrC
VRVERLVESRPAPLALSDEEAEALVQLGRRLRSDARWWGVVPDRESGVIECSPLGAGTWRVRVPEAIGMLTIRDVTIVVEPKIPMPHLLFLFAMSEQFPRVDPVEAQMATGEDLWQLVAAWYVGSAERLMLQGLAKDYREDLADLPVARGKVSWPRTVSLLLTGHARLSSRFEEYDHDTPMNRVLLSAAQCVARSPSLQPALRRRARRLAGGFDDVGDLHEKDVWARPDRLTARYAVPLQLALQVLRGSGRSLDAGRRDGSAFLLRTPDLVEEGIRHLVREALAEKVQVVKRGVLLKGGAYSLTPDLVFGSDAVGDVKYKLATGGWDRPDLYQLVAFATGFGVRSAVRVAFGAGAASAQSVGVGPVELTECLWPAEANLSPDEAAARLALAVTQWWDGLTQINPLDLVAPA